MAVGRRARFVVTGTTEWLVRIHGARDGRVRHVLRGHQSTVHAVATSPRADLFASGSDNGRLLIGSLSRGTWIRRVVARGPGIWALAFDARGETLYAGTDNGLVQAFRVRDGSPAGEHALGAQPIVALTVGAKQVLAGDHGGSVVLLDRRGLRERGRWKPHTGTVYGVSLLPSGRVASAGIDATVQAWDPRSSEPPAAVHRMGAGVSSMRRVPGLGLYAGLATGVLQRLRGLR